jgi:hypothetical protein
MTDAMLTPEELSEIRRLRDHAYANGYDTSNTDKLLAHIEAQQQAIDGLSLELAAAYAEGQHWRDAAVANRAALEADRGR